MDYNVLFRRGKSQFSVTVQADDLQSVEAFCRGCVDLAGHFRMKVAYKIGGNPRPESKLIDTRPRSRQK